MTKDKRTQWHPAFYSAMHLEFKDNKNELEFTEELILNTMPLRIDMLVVKKNTDCNIQNELGHIFEKHNLLEYKSPDDTLNYDAFLKGLAYAYLYKCQEQHIDDILLEHVTLTFIRERKPIKLFKQLQKKNFIIEEKWPGIYYIIKENFIKIQIVVTRRLSLENHLWLNSLSSNITVSHATKLITNTQKLKDLNDIAYADSLWDVVESVNKQTIQKVRDNKGMLCKALAEIMKPEIDEAYDNGTSNGKIAAFQNMIKEGISRELAQKCAAISDQLAEEALAELQNKVQ